MRRLDQLLMSAGNWQSIQEMGVPELQRGATDQPSGEMLKDLRGKSRSAWRTAPDLADRTKIDI